MLVVAAVSIGSVVLQPGVATATVRPGKRLTACDHVVHLGDSLTVRHAVHLRRAYRKIGIREPLILAGEGRGITFKSGRDTETGLQAASAARAVALEKSWKVCWVVALGTNDAAWLDSRERRWSSMGQLQRLIGADPVLWVDVWVFNNTDRPRYGVDRSTAWNSLLSARQRTRAAFHVLRWSEQARAHPEWYLTDRIHYRVSGAKARAAAITTELVRLFGS